MVLAEHGFVKSIKFTQFRIQKGTDDYIFGNIGGIDVRQTGAWKRHDSD